MPHDMDCQKKARILPSKNLSNFVDKFRVALLTNKPKRRNISLAVVNISDSLFFWPTRHTRGIDCVRGVVFLENVVWHSAQPPHVKHFCKMGIWRNIPMGILHHTGLCGV